MNLLKVSKILKQTGFFIFILGVIAISYSWGYMQSAIDLNMATFSSPAWVSIFSGIPFFVCSIIAFLASFIIYKKSLGVKQV